MRKGHVKLQSDYVVCSCAIFVVWGYFYRVGKGQGCLIVEFFLRNDGVHHVMMDC